MLVTARGLRDLLRLEALALEHVEEVGVAAEVQLVGAVDAHAAVRRTGCVSTRCVIVAPTCDLMSSPITGRPFFSKRCCQYCSRAMNTGMQFTNAQPASSTCSTYHLVASSEPDRQVVHHDVGARCRCSSLTMSTVEPGAFWMILRQVLAEAVVRHAALHGRRRSAAPSANTSVLFGHVEDRLGDVLADLVLVDVDRGRRSRRRGCGSRPG